jgi:hypothetical protein
MNHVNGPDESSKGKNTPATTGASYALTLNSFHGCFQVENHTSYIL